MATKGVELYPVGYNSRAGLTDSEVRESKASFVLNGEPEVEVEEREKWGRKLDFLHRIRCRLGKRLAIPLSLL